MLPELRYWDPT